MMPANCRMKGSKGIGGQILQRDDDEACRVKYSGAEALVGDAYRAGATKEGH